MSCFNVPYRLVRLVYVPPVVINHVGNLQKINEKFMHIQPISGEPGVTFIKARLILFLYLHKLEKTGTIGSRAWLARGLSSFARYRIKHIALLRVKPFILF
jgi:hypothetical protein